MTQSMKNARGTAAATEQPRRLFLTGGSGYVGRNVIRHFVARGVPVIALARSKASAKVVQDLGAIPFHADLLSPDLAEAMAGCDALVHAAADIDHGRGTPGQHRANVEGTRNLFVAARAAGIARAVHLSTESVLLDGRPLVNVSENHPLPRHPAGAYSRTKAAAEAIALSFAGQGMSVVVLRPRLVWGRDDTTALPQMLAAARSGQLAWIDGGHYKTSTTHIANLCHAIALALSHGPSGEIYFITDGEPVAFRAFMTQMLATQGVTAPDKTVPRWLVHAIARVGDIIGTLSHGAIAAPLTLQAYATSAVEVTLDISKARRDLGYAPVMSREEGFAEMTKG